LCTCWQPCPAVNRTQHTNRSISLEEGIPKCLAKFIPRMAHMSITIQASHHVAIAHTQFTVRKPIITSWTGDAQSAIPCQQRQHHLEIC
jgi:hypothetical protein